MGGCQRAAHLQRRGFYNNLIDHSGGDRRAWTGITWYRKHFKLPRARKDGKVFLEFEGLKQAGHFGSTENWSAG